MADLIYQLLASGDYLALSVGIFGGLAGGIFAAVLWLRLFRWVFALFGLGA